MTKGMGVAQKDGVPSTAMKAAFAAATEKGREGKKRLEVVGSASDELVDVESLLEGVIMSPEQLQAEKERALKNAEWAQNAADGLVKIRAQIKEIKEAGGVLNAARLKALSDAENKLLGSGNAAIKAHREFAEFLAEIRLATPDLKKAEGFIFKAIADGRYHKASEAELRIIQSLMRDKKPFPQGLIYLNGENYLSSVEGPAKSKGQMALEAELTRFVREAIKAHKASKEVEEADVNDDLRGLQQGRPGKYQIIFEERIDPKNGKKYYAGNGIVEIAIKKIDNGPIDQMRSIVPIRGFGSLKFFSNLAEKDFYVPASWYTGDLSTKRISGDFRDEAERFIRCLKAGVAAFYNRENGNDDEQ